MPGTGHFSFVNFQFSFEVRAQGIMGGEFARYRPGSFDREAFGLVNTGELFKLSIGVVQKFPAFLFDQGALAVTLAADRTYSPSAMETAPPTTAAAPATRMGVTSLVTPATPTTVAATETIPSFAPRTPSRSQFSRAAMLSSWGSFGCCFSNSDMRESKTRARHPHHTGLHTLPTT